VDVELQIGELTLVREIPEMEDMCFRSTTSRRRLDTGEALAAVSCGGRCAALNWEPPWQRRMLQLQREGRPGRGRNVDLELLSSVGDPEAAGSRVAKVTTWTRGGGAVVAAQG
jgi:hypothetical protein